MAETSGAVAAPASPELLEPLARGLRAPRAAGVAGLLFSALFVTSLVLLHDLPPTGASAAELKAYYEQGNGRYINLIGLYLAPFAGIAFLWFIAVARSHVGQRADRFFDTFTFAVKAAAVFMFVTSTIGFQTRGLPRWLVFVSWIVAALMLVSVAFWAPIIFVFPAWVAVISLVILFVGGVPS